MIRRLAIAVCLLVPLPAYADCTVSFNPGSGNNGQGQGGRPPSFSVDGCAANQGNTIDITNVNNFNTRFTDIENQITVNRNEARAGIAMAMAAASMNVGGAASGAGAGKIAAGLGFGDFEGTASLSAGIAYAVKKRFYFSGGGSADPCAG